jgi:hypothetical protein
LSEPHDRTADRRPSSSSSRTTPQKLSPIHHHSEENQKGAKRKASNAKLEPLSPNPSISKNPSEDTVESSRRSFTSDTGHSIAPSHGLDLHTIPPTIEEETNSVQPTPKALALDSPMDTPTSEKGGLSPFASPLAISAPLPAPSPKLEFICVDYRDGFNQKVTDRLSKSNSLFQYVESKQIKREFYDDYEDQAALEHEINLLRQTTISPLPSVQKPPKPPKGKTSNSKSKDSNKKIEVAVHPQRQKQRQLLLQRQQTQPEESNIIEDHATPLSPRSKYIDNCIRQKLYPRACLILRKQFTRELNLKHLGMGDKMAILLAEAIVQVPYIQSLNVCDNNLNDPGLSAIVDSIQHMKDLVELDMSFNVIGPDAAGSLANYLSLPSCPLKRLILQKADVDDDECRNFVEALEKNTCLEELDLSENLVGSSENLNSVMPDITTGGEALANLLQVPTCPLKILKLGWNMIRLDGAVSLTQSLATNTSLTYLELSYNSLSNQGGIALGDALQENTVLKTLKVANNSLDSMACLTICAGIFQNEALETICFDENPIGEQGAKVLMVSPLLFFFI